MGMVKVNYAPCLLTFILSIIEIKNKKCQICSKGKTPIELFYDKCIMSLDGLHTSDSPRQIDHPKCTISARDTIVLDENVNNYFKESLFENFICEYCSSGSSDSIKKTFTLCRNL